MKEAGVELGPLGTQSFRAEQKWHMQKTHCFPFYLCSPVLTVPTCAHLPSRSILSAADLAVEIVKSNLFFHRQVYI